MTPLTPQVLAAYLSAVDAHPFAALLIALTIIGCARNVRQHLPRSSRD